MAILAMIILVHFWVVYWATGPPTPWAACATIRTLQPSNLAHARPVSCPVWSLDYARRVLCGLTAHGHDHGHGAEKEK